MATTEVPHDLHLPAAHSADTISQLLAALPPDLAKRFPATVRNLAKLGDRQDKLIQTTARQERIDSAIGWGLVHLDLHDPAAIAALVNLLPKDASAQQKLTEDEIKQLEKSVRAFAKGKLAHPAVEQAPLPKIKGLPELVEFFKDNAIIQAERYRARAAKPKSPDANFDNLHMLRALQCFDALRRWQPAGISNFFGKVGVLNQAACVLGALAVDPKSTYPAGLGCADLPALLKRCQADLAPPVPLPAAPLPRKPQRPRRG